MEQQKTPNHPYQKAVTLSPEILSVLEETRVWAMQELESIWEIPFQAKKPNMSVDALLKAVQNTVITEKDVEALNKRLKAAEERFAEKERLNRIGQSEFLNRRYTI